VGSASLLIKNVARDRLVFSKYWGNALFLNVASGSLLVLLVLLVARLLLPAHISSLLILCVALGDLIFTRLLDNSASAFQAFDSLHVTAQLYLFAGVARLLGAIALHLLVPRPTATAWAVLYLIAAAVSGLLGVVLVCRRLGRPHLALHLFRREALEGVFFSCGQSTETIYNDIDKTMLTALSDLESAGIYAAAYRIIDVTFVPVNSFLWASYSHFFIKGAAGIESSLAYAKRLLSRAGIYSIAASLGLFLLAPLVPRIIGSQYLHTVEAMRWLAAIPILRMFHRFLAYALAGAGYQGARTAAQGGAALLNVFLNLWLIPAYSWRGAAWSSLACDGLLAGSLFLIASFIRRQHSKALPAPAFMPVVE
jgi:O-antigen/teichoic acid export membrane protein